MWAGFSILNGTDLLPDWDQRVAEAVQFSLYVYEESDMSGCKFIMVYFNNETILHTNHSSQIFCTTELASLDC